MLSPGTGEELIEGSGHVVSEPARWKGEQLGGQLGGGAPGIWIMRRGASEAPPTQSLCSIEEPALGFTSRLLPWRAAIQSACLHLHSQECLARLRVSR